MRNEPSVKGRRVTAVSCLILVGAAAFLGGSAPSMAQGFFEQLFGPAKPKRPPPLSARMPRPVQSGVYGVIDRRARAATGYRVSNYALSRRRSAGPRHGGDDDSSNDAGPRQGGANYRTFCVRTCDGYYFPLSHSVRRGRFYRDAEKCRSKCGDAARLYYLFDDMAPEKMRSLQGLAYTELKTAFLYRKRLVKGCRCKPQPWAQSERDRHRMYELNEPRNRRQARLSGNLEFLAGKGGVNRPAAKKMSPEKAAGRFGTVPAAALGTLLPTAGGGASRPAAKSGRAERRRSYRLSARGDEWRRGGRSIRRRQRRRGKVQGGAPWGLGTKPKYRWPGD